MCCPCVANSKKQRKESIGCFSMLPTPIVLYSRGTWAYHRLVRFEPCPDTNSLPHKSRIPPVLVPKHAVGAVLVSSFCKRVIPRARQSLVLAHRKWFTNLS